MRVLHLIDAVGPQANETSLALLQDSLDRVGGVEQHVLLLGSGRLRKQAAAVGIVQASALAVPFGRAVLGWRVVQKYVEQLGGVDVIHCWSVGALSLATMLFRSTPRVLTLTVTPAPAAVKWLSILTRESQGSTVLLAMSATIRRGLISGGVAQEVAVLLRPAIDMSRVKPSSRSRWREKWGVEGSVESDTFKVLALLCDPPGAADTLAASLAMGLASETVAVQGRKLRLLVHPDQVNRLRAQKVMRQIGREGQIIQEPGLARPWTVLPGCDLALIQGPSGGGLSLLWAMAANVPIVAEATYAVSEMIEDRHTALLAQLGVPKSMAARITQLLGDNQLAWKLRDTARHEAYSFFSRQRYCRSLGGVYEQVAGGQQVEVPAMEATGGLVFSGRG